MNRIFSKSRPKQGGGSTKYNVVYRDRMFHCFGNVSNQITTKTNHAKKFGEVINVANNRVLPNYLVIIRVMELVIKPSQRSKSVRVDAS